MRWKFPWLGGLLAVGLLAGCDQITLGPPRAASAPPAPEAAAPAVDFRALAGQSYSDFAAGAGAQYAPDAMGLTAADRARVWRAMAIGRPAELVQGGGAEALVFRGCDEAGCEVGAAVVAIDVATGGAFVGVRDVGGADELAQNDRVEALLTLTSPSGRWDEPPAS